MCGKAYDWKQRNVNASGETLEMVKERTCVNGWQMQSVKWQDNPTEQIEAPKIRWRGHEV